MNENVSENIQLRKKVSDSFSSESEDEYKVFFFKSSRSSWTKLKRALQHYITWLYWYTPLSLYSISVCCFSNLFYWYHLWQRKQCMKLHIIGLLRQKYKKVFSAKCRFSGPQNAGHTKSWIFWTWSMHTYKTLSNLKGIE